MKNKNVNAILELITCQSIHVFKGNTDDHAFLQPWEHMVVIYSLDIAIKYIWDTREVTGIIEGVTNPTKFLAESNVQMIDHIDNRRPLRCSNPEIYNRIAEIDDYFTKLDQDPAMIEALDDYAICPICHKEQHDSMCPNNAINSDAVQYRSCQY